MRVVKDINELRGLKIISLSIGNFDGVHLGHQAIIKIVTHSAHSLLVTFAPHPQEILSEGKRGPSPTGVLTPIEEKVAIIEGYGVENLFVLQFSPILAYMEAEDFIKWLVVDYIKPKKIVIGYNHRFGRDAKGDFELLVHMGARFGFKVIRVPPVYMDGFPISSTWTRRALLKGEVELVNRLLGRPYSIRAQVIQGDNRGTKLSYPTANLRVTENKLIPKNGVYAGLVEYKQKRLGGMINIGDKPTFDKPFGIEVHIFDFNKNLINEYLKIEFVKYLRETRRFVNSSALKSQLQQDEQLARQVLVSG